MISVMRHRTRGLTESTPHQRQAYDHLAQNPRACLFLGMSLFKTCITLSYLNDMIYQELRMERVLVIAPDKVARLTWPDEIRDWEHLQGMRFSVVEGTEKKRVKALEAEAEVYLVSVDNIVWLINQHDGRLPYDCIVFDELSLFKSRGSARSKKVRKALKLSNPTYRIGLTGTPSPNGMTDLWAELHMIDDGERLGQTWGKFQDKYFRTRGNGMIVYEYIPLPGALNTIARKIADICLTMNTRDHVELPPDRLEDILLELDPFDRETYEHLEREYFLEFTGRDYADGAVTVKTPADLTNKLLQVSSGAIYEDDLGGVGPRVWHEINTLKIDALEAYLKRNKGHNVMLVYQFRHEIERIKAAFPQAQEFGKGAKAAQTQDDWNAGRIPLLLIHPASAGHGLNLQFGGSRMLWFTCTWNLEHWEQTIARLLRKGQEHEVKVARLIARGTRDVRVAKRIEIKQSDQDFLKDEIKQLRQKYGKVRK